MSAFEGSTAYLPQEAISFNDGREGQLVEYVTSQFSIRGSPAEVLRAIDEFGRTKKYLMNVGDAKGKIVVDTIREKRPKVMLELGGYCGYSTILFADALRECGGEKYYSLEQSPEFAQNIRELVAFAGLDDVVEVIAAPSDQGIRQLHKDKKIQCIDMMFLDHYKPAYASDLKLCESLGFIRPGAVMVADNVISPGNPPYLKYVRSTVAQKREALKTSEHAADDTQHFSARTVGKYEQSEASGGEVKAKGNPNLIYQSQLINSFEPTGTPDGVEVTRCVGEESE